MLCIHACKFCTTVTSCQPWCNYYVVTRTSTVVIMMTQFGEWPKNAFSSVLHTVKAVKAVKVWTLGSQLKSHMWLAATFSHLIQPPSPGIFSLKEQRYSWLTMGGGGYIHCTCTCVCVHCTTSVALAASYSYSMVPIHTVTNLLHVYTHNYLMLTTKQKHAPSCHKHTPIAWIFSSNISWANFHTQTIYLRLDPSFLQLIELQQWPWPQLVYHEPSTGHLIWQALIL